MEIIESGRRTGKTETLLRWMLAGQPREGVPNSWDRTIIVSDRVRAEWLRDRLRQKLRVSAHEWNADDHEAYDRWCVLSANIEVIRDVLDSRRLGNAYRPAQYVIDDLDDVLAVVFGQVPAIVTRRPDGER